VLLASLAGAALVAAVAFVGPAGPHATPRLRNGIAAKASPNGWFATSGEEFESAPEQSPVTSFLKWLAAGALAGVLMSVTSAPAEASLYVGVDIEPNLYTVKTNKYLTPCKDNKKFNKIVKNELFKYSQFQKKYKQMPAVQDRLKLMIKKAENRKAAYADVLCGKRDGIPRTIANGQTDIRRSVVAPGFAFLYIAGWIGWSGREYLKRTRDPMKETYIDLPLFATCMASGFAWPVRSWIDIVNGDFVKNDSDFYSSGRTSLQEWN